MKGISGVYFLAIVLIQGVDVFAQPEPPISDFTLLQQNRPSPLDVRPRLSAIQQAQILSDVQQHQHRQRQPQQQQQFSLSVNNGVPRYQGFSTDYPSLAKYKVDRTKQQQQQQDQLKISRQLAENYVNGVTSVPGAYQLQGYPAVPSQRYNDYRPKDPTAALDTRERLQLQAYLEKQRELELLEKQRQQLLLEQQELKRQQELLRLQEISLSRLATTNPPLSSSPPLTVTARPTERPLLLSSPTARKITASEAELFLRAIASHQKKFSTSTASTVPVTDEDRRHPTRPIIQTSPITAATSSVTPSAIPSAIPSATTRITALPTVSATVRATTSTNSGRSTRPTSSTDRTEKEELLKQLKLALAQSGEGEDLSRNVSTRDLVLPNGKKIQLIRAPDLRSGPLLNLTSESSSIRTTLPSSTIKPPKAIFEELTKGGVLPPGADFELIRQKSDGNLEEIGKVPIQNLPSKKVTFVVLEEQPDGSYKVQGVKGNAGKESGDDVHTIVERIKKGELKLPPPTSVNPIKSTTVDGRLASPGPNTFESASKSTTAYYPVATATASSVFVSSPSSSTADEYATSGTSPADRTVSSYTGRLHSSSSTTSSFVTTASPAITEQTSSTFSRPTSQTRYSPRPTFAASTTPRSLPSTTTTESFRDTQRENTVYKEQDTSLPARVNHTQNQVSRVNDDLVTLLKREGLFAMAKYLRQSGLDNVLNETGPYTVFVPTDKAFRTLLVQLGGPEKAEQKFQENPRLLSGLLLHHVIPGAFRVDALQDEMTGVSLAGTQLRVNEYTMHDHEWNDVKVTTINGARIAPNKRDVEIPQGIAHAIDRVMFPLPVGDLVQTLQADRERRFTTFLRMLRLSGLEDTLTGGKTFTVFAPTDSAFAAAIAANKNDASAWKDTDDPETAKAIVSKHIIPSTLYTAGMRYYLQKDTLRPQAPLHIHKNGGRIRVNEAYIVTYNVPATNGVLHAIDGVI